MTTDFLDFELTEAQITRGLFWWQRRAQCVYAITERGLWVWRYANSGVECEPWLSLLLDSARTAEYVKRQRAEDLARYEQDWQLTVSLGDWLRFPVRAGRR